MPILVSVAAVLAAHDLAVGILFPHLFRVRALLFKRLARGKKRRGTQRSDRDEEEGDNGGFHFSVLIGLTVRSTEHRIDELKMSRQTSISKGLLEAAAELCDGLADLRFAEPTTHVYNPLVYARRANELYVKRFAAKKKRCVMMGMNPGPWGMAQTGIPFGEVAMVRDWMGIEVAVDKPEGEHPKRPVEGFACGRSEVSGRRLWGLFSERYPAVDDFFAEHFVLNYCPLVFMEESGKNRTPDKLPRSEAAAVEAACDRHLARVLELLQPEFAIGVGAFAETRLKGVAAEGVTVGKILHPSPASPAANRGWAEAATKQLVEQGIWAR